ncbi:MAG: hypothetical protein ACXQS3_03375, partial [Candidatus Methanofastidiosia archaeon]
YIGGVPPKKIGVGCVRADDEKVESIEGVYNLLRYAAWCVGEENVIAVPDCGMKILPRDIATRKVAVMCAAANKLDGDLESEKNVEY